ncbi:MAG: FKBP-type peptidyl-prolyl cis-trans isomerase [Verrucomicrobiota bacterium]|nr:FKBP-type peptidyl-prolyl cis-trans isomerase [Verrucomicrobiota bacterium]
MKKKIWMLVLCLAAAPVSKAADTNVLSDTQSRVSYAIGMRFGSLWKQQGIEVNDDLFLRGLKDAQSGRPTLLTEQEMQSTLMDFQKELVAKQQKMREEAAKTNLAAADAFLAENKTKPGVVTLPDGLQYKVVKEGSGPIPTADDTVTVNYRGTLIDGKEFDSSAKHGHPAEFRVGGVIRGWTEALTRMKVGSKWQLFIPPDLAYGPMGRQPVIPPNSALIFDVELLSIQHPAPPPAAAHPTNPPLTSDIIKVPSLAEMKKGAKVEIIKPDELQKLQQQAQSATNHSATNQ